MTLQEIDDLKIEDVQSILEANLIRLSEDEDYVVTQEDLEVEFEIYKSALTTVEVERLRIKDLKTRISVLNEANYAHMVLYPEIPNAALFRKEKILTNSDKDEAEDIMVALEEQDAVNFKELEDNAYKDSRKAEYPTIEEIVVAIIEDDTEVIEEIKTRRNAVKAKYPKS